jgi:hypothetical protein
LSTATLLASAIQSVFLLEMKKKIQESSQTRNRS